MTNPSVHSIDTANKNGAARGQRIIPANGEDGDRVQMKETAASRQRSHRANRSDGRSRTHDSIVRAIGTAIISGKYQPGDLLAGEIGSSETLDVSRTAYREAVRTVMAKGLLETSPKVGTRITPRSAWNLLDPDVLAWTFESDPDIDLLESFFEFRNIIESAAAEIAATRRASGHLDQMRDAIGRIADHSLETAEGRLADRQFHAAVLAATENPYIVSLTASVSMTATTTTMPENGARSFSRPPVPDRLRVFQAIADRDPERAHREMDVLIQLTLQETQVRQHSKLRPIQLRFNQGRDP